MNLCDLEVYKTSMRLGELTWEWINKWEHYYKETIGKQLVRAADSVAANISEAEGRYNFPDRKRFYYIARGSLYESETWIAKSLDRKLLTLHEYDVFMDLSIQCRKMINSYIMKMKQRI